MHANETLNMTEDLKPGVVIIGLNALTRTVIDTLELINNFQISGIIDIKETANVPSLTTSQPVFNSLDDLFVLEKKKNIKHVVICVLDGNQRKNISEIIQKSSPGLIFICVVHPSAVLAKHMVFGKGSIIGSGVVLNSDCKLGDFCIVKDQVSIGHDCEIGNFVTLKKNVTLGGHVSVGSACTLQSNVSIIEKVIIGENCLIKESTLVLKDIPKDSIADGIPAKIIKY